MIAPEPPRHTCHADGCNTDVAPELFMCSLHWSMVPPAFRQAITATYRPGQEIDKTPSAEYLSVATAAIAAVAHKETRTAPRAPRTRTTVAIQLALFDIPQVRDATR